LKGVPLNRFPVASRRSFGFAQDDRALIKGRFFGFTQGGSDVVFPSHSSAPLWNELALLQRGYKDIFVYLFYDLFRLRGGELNQFIIRGL
jgi:hypothetical protein